MLSFLNENTAVTNTLVAVALWFFISRAITKEHEKILKLVEKDLNERFSHVKGDISEIQKDLKNLNARFSHLSGHYQNRSGYTLGADLTTADSRSPLNLTEKGVELANKIDVFGMVDKYVRRVEDTIPKGANSYHIQKRCLIYAMETFRDVVSAEEREIIEKAIYEEGGKDLEVLIVFVILFRNKIMKNRKLTPPPLPNLENTG